jgi:hypothetical protein
MKNLFKSLQIIFGALALIQLTRAGLVIYSIFF